MKIIFFKISLMLSVLLVGEMLNGQSCGTGNIIINSQAELNDFVVNYGACDSIVPGTKLIIDDTANDITDLTPLSNLVYISWLEIYRTDITSLAGLENISQTTMSKCIITDNPLLTDISQLTGLTPGVGALSISGSPLLIDLTGIDNNTIFGTSLTLKNLGITSLNDLAITRIDAYLTIEDNAALVDISSLTTLTNFGGGANGGFNIRNNSLLDDCSSICSLVKNLLPVRPQVIVDISGNLGNCIDEATVIANCGRTPCGQTDITIASQARVNSFQVDHGPCDSITGTLFIDDSNINLTDLSKLSTLETVEGININSNTLLTDLSGLENLEVRNLGNIIIANNDILTDVSQLSGIGQNIGTLVVENCPKLTDLSIFDNLNLISEMTIRNMPGIVNLDAFSNVTDIARTLVIQNNISLNNISGLGNVSTYGDSVSGYFVIEDNPLLFDCSPVCGIVTDILPTLSNWNVTIQNNLGPCVDEQTVVNTCCDHPDYAALEALYNAMDGPNWNDNSGWLQDCDPCGIVSGTPWFGVFCNAAERVFELNFALNSIPNNLLVGTLPPELFTMSELRILNLGHTDAIGSIPEEFCSSGIRSFNIALCPNLTAPLPDCISEKNDLITFSVIAGGLTGPLPSFDANNATLNQIRFENNNMSGPIPTGWGNLPNINTIRIQGNQLSGSYSPSLSNLCPLAHVNAWISDGNNFDAAWEDFCASASGQSACGNTYTHIPDNNFEQALIDKNIDSEGLLDGCVLSTDLGSVQDLDISKNSISDLTGIEGFRALENLIVHENSLPATTKLSNNINLKYVKASF